MRQIQFRLGLRASAPDPTRGAYIARPDPLAGFEGPTSNGGEGRKRGGDERGGKRGGEESGGRRREGKGGLSGNVAEEAFCLKSAPVSCAKNPTRMNSITTRRNWQTWPENVLKLII